MRLILLAILLLQAAPAQSEADKLEAALKKFGDRSYLIFVNGEKVGSCLMKTRVEKDRERAVAVFEDRENWSMASGDSVVRVTEKASLDRLRLLSSESAFHKEKTIESRSMVVDETRGVLKVDGREQKFDLTETTVGEQAVVRLVCAAEQREGASFKVDVLDRVLEHFQPGHAFRCLGREPVEIGGKKVDSFKWEEKGEWKLTKKDGDTGGPKTWRVNHTYWVSPDGYLLRFDNGDLTVWVLDAK